MMIISINMSRMDSWQLMISSQIYIRCVIFCSMYSRKRTIRSLADICIHHSNHASYTIYNRTSQLGTKRTEKRYTSHPKPRGSHFLEPLDLFLPRRKDMPSLVTAPPLTEPAEDDRINLIVILELVDRGDLNKVVLQSKRLICMSSRAHNPIRNAIAALLIPSSL